MTKRILLFLVEGLSDKDALEPILSELVDNTRVHFEVLRCDLSAKNSIGMYNSNIKLSITNVIKNYLENNRGIKKHHIEKIIFISDTDGCYINEENIYYSKIDQHFRYEDDGIYTNRPEDAIRRNMIKSKNLNIINTISKVYALSIETYFFSCNLDHVLHGKRNLEQNLKEEYAINFADRYENKEVEFIDFISDNALCLAYEYRKTWATIKLEKNSLLKYTNLFVFFINNIDFLKDEVREKVNAYLSLLSL